MHWIRAAAAVCLVGLFVHVEQGINLLISLHIVESVLKFWFSILLLKGGSQTDGPDRSLRNIEGKIMTTKYSNNVSSLQERN